MEAALAVLEENAFAVAAVVALLVVVVGVTMVSLRVSHALLPQLLTPLFPCSSWAAPAAV